MTTLSLPPIVAAGAVVDSLGREWDPLEHPRGRDGKFIHTFKRIRAFLGGMDTDPWMTGETTKINPDGSIRVRITKTTDPNLVDPASGKPYVGAEVDIAPNLVESINEKAVLNLDGTKPAKADVFSSLGYGDEPVTWKSFRSRFFPDLNNVTLGSVGLDDAVTSLRNALNNNEDIEEWDANFKEKKGHDFIRDAAKYMIATRVLSRSETLNGDEGKDVIHSNDKFRAVLAQLGVDDDVIDDTPDGLSGFDELAGRVRAWKNPQTGLDFAPKTPGAIREVEFGDDGNRVAFFGKDFGGSESPVTFKLIDKDGNVDSRSFNDFAEARDAALEPKANLAPETPKTTAPQPPPEPDDIAAADLPDEEPTPDDLTELDDEVEQFTDIDTTDVRELAQEIHLSDSEYGEAYADSINAIATGVEEGSYSIEEARASLRELAQEIDDEADDFDNTQLKKLSKNLRVAADGLGVSKKADLEPEEELVDAELPDTLVNNPLEDDTNYELNLEADDFLPEDEASWNEAAQTNGLFIEDTYEDENGNHVVVSGTGKNINNFMAKNSALEFVDPHDYLPGVQNSDDDVQLESDQETTSGDIDDDTEEESTPQDGGTPPTPGHEDDDTSGGVPAADDVDAGPDNGDTSEQGPVKTSFTTLEGGPITLGEKTALDSYTGVGFMDINNFFRDGGTDADLDYYPNAALDIGGMDSLMSRSKLTTSTTLYRGLKQEDFSDEKWDKFIETMEEGGIISDLGFISTTHDESVAGHFAHDGEDGQGIVFEFDVPAGHNAIDVASHRNAHDIKHPYISHLHDPEKEIILQRGSKFRIDSIEQESGGWRVYATATYDDTPSIDGDLPEDPTDSLEQVLEADNSQKFEVLDDPGTSGDGYFLDATGKPYTNPNGSKMWGKYGASGVLVRHVDDEGVERFLLVQRGNSGYNKGKWQLPGGALESKENDYQGAARELTEELAPPEGYLDKLSPVGEVMFNHPSGWHYNNIAADAAEQFDPKVDGHETSAGGWFTRDEIANDIVLHPALEDNLDALFKQFTPDQGVATPSLAPVDEPETEPVAATLADFPQPSLTSDEHWAIHQVYGYAWGYKLLNPYLHHNKQVWDSNIGGYRDVTEKEDATAQKAIAALDSAFAKAQELDHPVTVERRSGLELFSDPGSMVGKDVINLGYTSTATKLQKHGYGYESKPAIWEITLPVGTKAIQANAFEQEILLNRGAVFHVTDDTTLPNGDRRIKMTYVPSGVSDKPVTEHVDVTPEPEPQIPETDDESERSPEEIDLVGKQVTITNGAYKGTTGTVMYKHDDGNWAVLGNGWDPVFVPKEWLSVDGEDGGEEEPPPSYSNVDLSQKYRMEIDLSKADDDFKAVGGLSSHIDDIYVVDEDSQPADEDQPGYHYVLVEGTGYALKDLHAEAFPDVSDDDFYQNLVPATDDVDEDIVDTTPAFPPEVEEPLAPWEIELLMGDGPGPTSDDWANMTDNIGPYRWNQDNQRIHIGDKVVGADGIEMTISKFEKNNAGVIAIDAEGKKRIRHRNKLKLVNFSADIQAVSDDDTAPEVDTTSEPDKPATSTSGVVQSVSNDEDFSVALATYLDSIHEASWSNGDAVKYNNYSVTFDPKSGELTLANDETGEILKDIDVGSDFDAITDNFLTAIHVDTGAVEDPWDVGANASPEYPNGSEYPGGVFYQNYTHEELTNAVDFYHGAHDELTPGAYMTVSEDGLRVTLNDTTGVWEMWNTDEELVDQWADTGEEDDFFENLVNAVVTHGKSAPSTASPEEEEAYNANLPLPTGSMLSYASWQGAGDAFDYEFQGAVNSWADGVAGENDYFDAGNEYAVTYDSVKDEFVLWSDKQTLEIVSKISNDNNTAKNIREAIQAHNSQNSTTPGYDWVIELAKVNDIPKNNTAVKQLFPSMSSYQVTQYRNAGYALTDAVKEEPGTTGWHKAVDKAIYNLGQSGPEGAEKLAQVKKWRDDSLAGEKSASSPSAPDDSPTITLPAGYATPSNGTKAVYEYADDFTGKITYAVVDNDDKVKYYYSDGQVGATNTTPAMLKSFDGWDQYTGISEPSASVSAPGPDLSKPHKMDMYNNPMFVGDKVWWATKNKEVTVLNFENNDIGVIVQSVMPDGTKKKHALNRNKLKLVSSAAHSPQVATNKSGAPPSIITPVTVSKPIEPDINSPWFGVPAPEKPQLDETGTQEGKQLVDDAWLEKAEENYKKGAKAANPNWVEKPLSKSYTYSRYVAVSKGDKTALTGLLNKGYITPEMYEDALAQINKNNKAYEDALAKNTELLKKWREDTKAWRTANGLPSIQLKGMNNGVLKFNNTDAKYWMNQNQKPGSLTPQGKLTGNAYQAIASQKSSNISGTLRAAKEKTLDPEWIAQHGGIAAAADKAMLDSPPLKEDFMVTRTFDMHGFINPATGMPYSSSDNLSNLAGTIQHDWGFAETSVGSYDAGATVGYNSGRPIHMQLRVPAGTRGVWTLHPSQNFGHAGERGFILERGIAYYIHSVEYTNGKWRVNAEIIPKDVNYDQFGHFINENPFFD